MQKSFMGIFGILKRGVPCEIAPFDLVLFLQANYINNSSLVKRSIIGDTRFDLAYNRKFLED